MFYLIIFMIVRSAITITILFSPVVEARIHAHNGDYEMFAFHNILSSKQRTLVFLSTSAIGSVYHGVDEIFREDMVLMNVNNLVPVQ